MLNSKISAFDHQRLSGRIEAKKARLDQKTLTESAPGFSEFKELVPYLDLSYPNQKEGLPSFLGSGTLPHLYWSLKMDVIDERLLSNRKYWE